MQLLAVDQCPIIAELIVKQVSGGAFVCPICAPQSWIFMNAFFLFYFFGPDIW